MVFARFVNAVVNRSGSRGLVPGFGGMVPRAVTEYHISPGSFRDWRDCFFYSAVGWSWKFVGSHLRRPHHAPTYSVDLCNRTHFY